MRACRGELDRQREPVEALAQVRHACERAFVVVERRPGGSRTVAEQLDRLARSAAVTIAGGERLEEHDLLPRHPQRFA